MDELEQDAAAWVAHSTGQAVVAVTALTGGMSSVVHRCELQDGTRVVLKHIRDREWLAREPDLIVREARALDLLAADDLPVPRHVADDPVHGLLLTSALPGRMVLEPGELAARTGALASLAARIAAVQLPVDHGLPAYHSYAPAELEPPDWGDTGLWRAGIDAFRSVVPPIAVRPHLLHRDLHPLNVLWTGHEVTGLVDWLSACVGHPHAELSHCRWNLAIAADPDAADALADRYVATTDGEPYSGWWDLSTVMGLLPGPITIWGYHRVGRLDLTTDLVIERTEEFLRRALDRV